MEPNSKAEEAVLLVVSVLGLALAANKVVFHVRRIRALSK